MEAGQNGTGRKGTEQRGMVEGRDATERNGKEGTTQNGTGQRNHFSSPWCTHRGAWREFAVATSLRQVGGRCRVVACDGVKET